MRRILLCKIPPPPPPSLGASRGHKVRLPTELRARAAPVIVASLLSVVMRRGYTRQAAACTARSFAPYGCYAARVYPRLSPFSSYWLRQLFALGNAMLGRNGFKQTKTRQGRKNSERKNRQKKLLDKSAAKRSVHIFNKFQRGNLPWDNQNANNLNSARVSAAPQTITNFPSSQKTRRTAPSACRTGLTPPTVCTAASR